jgi:ribosome-associated protein
MSNIDLNKILKEVTYNFSRSGGKGGQNVNKVETKVELVFNINESMTLDNSQKKLFLKKLHNKTDKEGNIRVISQTERTQLGNKKKVIEKFVRFINNALKKDKVRIRTVKSISTKEEILRQKKLQSQKKKQRSQKDFFAE